MDSSNRSLCTSTQPVPRPDPECIAQFATQLAGVRAIARFHGKANIVFLGDSITHNWEWVGESWKREWAPRRTLNLGIGGDQTQHLLFRLQNGAIDGIKPQAIVQMIGVNNLWCASAEEIAEGVAACLEAIRDRQKTARVLALAVLPLAAPHGEKNSMIGQINRRIASRASKLGCDFMDLAEDFLQGQAEVSTTFMPDGVHLSPGGYELLTSRVLHWLGA